MSRYFPLYFPRKKKGGRKERKRKRECKRERERNGEIETERKKRSEKEGERERKRVREKERRGGERKKKSEREEERERGGRREREKKNLGDYFPTMRFVKSTISQISSTINFHLANVISVNPYLLTCYRILRYTT